MLQFFLYIYFLNNPITKRKLNCHISKSCYNMAFMTTYIIQQIKNEFPIRYKAIFLIGCYIVCIQ